MVKTKQLFSVIAAAVTLALGGCTTAAVAPAPAVAPTPSLVTPVQEPTPAPPATVATPAPNITTPPPPGIATIVPAPMPAKQGAFVLSDLTVVPNTIRLFNSANVSVVVTNNGTAPGTYTVVLTVKTATSRSFNITQNVTLAAGASETVSFDVYANRMGNGTHVVEIDGLHERVAVDSQI